MCELAARFQLPDRIRLPTAVPHDPRGSEPAGASAATEPVTPILRAEVRATIPTCPVRIRPWTPRWNRRAGVQIFGSMFTIFALIASLSAVGCSGTLCGVAKNEEIGGAWRSARSAPRRWLFRGDVVFPTRNRADVGGRRASASARVIEHAMLVQNSGRDPITIGGSRLRACPGRDRGERGYGAACAPARSQMLAWGATLSHRDTERHRTTRR